MDINTSSPRTTEGMLKELYTSSSRRSFVVRCGTSILRLLGISLLPVLPLVRIAKGQSACGAWFLCGIFGRLCTCTGCGGTTQSCPSCATKGSFWQECCLQSCEQFSIQYIDCCTNSSSCYTPCSNCEFCERGTSEPSWCAGYAYYCCTIVKIGEACQ